MNNGAKPINAVYGMSGALYTGNGADKFFLENQNPLIGLTKREYFAAMAMSGILSAPVTYSIDGNVCKSANDLAKYAVIQADALLKALES